MGIPLYFKTLYNDYPEIVIKNIDGNNFLFLDLNCAIHPCCRKVMTTMDYNFYNHDLLEAKMIQSVLAYIEKLVKLVGPSLLYIAIDGVVPIAKMLQQRQRRFKSSQDKIKEINIREKCGMETDSVLGWDTNAISPGTEFMEKLNGDIESFIRGKLASNYDNMKVIFSSSHVPGEGEHKILNFIKTNKLELSAPDNNFVIYGLDADLIMLSMVSAVENVYLLREEVEFTKKGSNVSEDHFLYLDTNLLKRRLGESIHNEYLKIDPLFKYNPESASNMTPKSRETGNFIDDYIVFCFFFGNDFMPHTPSIDLRNNGHQILLQAYTKTRHVLNEHLVIRGKINTAFIIYFLDLLTEQENKTLLKLERDRSKFNIRRFQFKDDYEKETQLLNNFPMINRESEKNINAGTRGWRNRYYSTCFSIDANDSYEIDTITCNYFEVLKWTFDYYFNGDITFYCGYNYAYAPTVFDMVKYLRKTNISLKDITFKKGTPYNSLVQLMYILPDSSKNLIPTSCRDLMNNKNSRIRHYYPNGEIPVETCFKRYWWQCSPILPPINIELLKNVLKSVKISTKEKKRYTRGKIQVFN